VVIQQGSLKARLRLNSGTLDVNIFGRSGVQRGKQHRDPKPSRQISGPATLVCRTSCWPSGFCWRNASLVTVALNGPMTGPRENYRPRRASASNSNGPTSFPFRHISRSHHPGRVAAPLRRLIFGVALTLHLKAGMGSNATAACEVDGGNGHALDQLLTRFVKHHRDPRRHLISYNIHTWHLNPFPVFPWPRCRPAHRDCSWT